MAERELRADCARCAALCCIAPAFAKSSDFAIDKPAGRACPNLAGSLCSIHDHLTGSGFRGCVVFDCFGAGQRITQEITDRPAERLALLPVVRQLHELMWYLAEAIKLDEAKPLHDKLRAAFDATDRLAGGAPAQLGKMDLVAYRQKVNPLLQKASRLARGRGGKDFSGRNMIGRKLNGADLRGAGFRGALLIGADLRGADLRRADFTGADVRGADLRGADLRGVLFLTESQRRAAVTDQP